MKIAFVSYEFPPDTAFGGIATYLQQASAMLVRRGHYVEVFTSSGFRSGTEEVNGVIVTRVQDPDPASFPDSIAPVFARHYNSIKFDVLEGPEYSADARRCVALVPNIPLVIKLHTPSFLVRRFSRTRPRGLKQWCERAKTYLDVSSVAEVKREIDDIEREHTVRADEVAAPSRAIQKMLMREWGLNAAKCSLVPYPYIPSPEFLHTPVETSTNRVMFLGRLEIRKGVIDLADAIPRVLKRHPEARFLFVGTSENSPDPSLDMRQFLEQRLRPWMERINFRNGVPLEQIPGLLALTDICVFPSIWENFPLVCLESMAAARGIVASRSGGMSEMLDNGRAGYLVAPNRPSAIAKAVNTLLDDPKLRIRLGTAARQRVLSEYAETRIGPIQEASYERAIARRAAAGIQPSPVS